MNSLRVCFITENFYPQVGGVETEFWEFSKHLHRLGCEVRVVAGNGGGITGHRNYDGVDVFYYPWLSFCGHPVPRKKDLRDHVEWADIVQTTTYTAAHPSQSVCMEFHKPCILSVQECLGRKWFVVERNPVTAAIYYAVEYFTVTRSFQHWHAISESTKQDTILAGIPEERISRVYLGIDEEFWDPATEASPLYRLFDFPEKSRIFLFFGRPGQTKGINVLLGAIRALQHSLPEDVRFGLILGDHPKGARQNVERRLKLWGIGDMARVVQSVPRTELRAYVKSAYSVIIPSITEGFGFSAAEASSLGVPIISSDGGSLPEVVFGEHRFFRNMSSDDLARNIHLAIDGEWDYRPPVSFKWEEFAKSLLKLYKTTLSSFR